MQEAAISVSKNRVKIYNGNSVYLKNGQEFEIELFNPSQATRLAKISINGKFISNSGLVLKPGQRVYLERYIDTPAKFKYETYVVNGNDAAAVAAIANNGDIQVWFYDELDFSSFKSTWNSSTCLTTTFSWTGTINTSSGGTGSVTSYSAGAGAPFFNNINTTSNTPGVFGGQQVNSLSSRRGRAGGQSCSTGDLADSLDLSEAATDWEDIIKHRSAPTKLKETGRIEQGSKSNQGLTEYHGSFGVIANTIVKIRIFPFSEKPLEAQDLANYCTSCGSKNKGNKYKFCPVCGTKY